MLFYGMKIACQKACVLGIFSSSIDERFKKMIHKKLLGKLLLLAFVTVAASANSAVITQLFDPATLTLSNDFESTKDNGDVTFEASAEVVLARLYADSVTPSGIKGLADTLGNAPLEGTLSSPSTAIGLWFGNDDFGYTFDAMLEVFFGGGSLGSVTVAANRNDFADQFIGLSSDTAFDRFQITYQRPEAQELSVYVDDLYLGKAGSIPLPATLALFGLGLAGLGWSRRKKA
jgi:hypothetical protein